MQFSSYFVTEAGLSLITRLLSGTEMVWGEVVFTSDTLTSSSTSVSDKICGGNVVAAFTQDTVQLSCSLTNTYPNCVSGNAKSLAIFAKIAGDSQYSLALAAVLDSSLPIPAYSISDMSSLVRILVSLSLTMANGVIQSLDIVEPNVYALATDLQTEITEREDLSSSYDAFSNRVVTTHTSNSDTSGDNQSIYGSKTFMNYTYFNSGVSISGVIKMPSSYVTPEIQVVRESGKRSSYMNLSLPQVSNESNVTLFKVQATRDSSTKDLISFFTYSTTLGSCVMWVSSKVDFSDTTHFDDTVTFDSGGVSFLSDIFIDGVGVTGSATVSATLTYASDVILNDNVTIRSTSSGSNQTYIGTSLYPIDHVYANHLHGVTSYSSRDNAHMRVVVPKGALACIYGVTALAGTTFKVSVDQYKEATLSGAEGTHYVTEGIYVAITSNVSTSGALLAMMIDYLR